MKRAALAVLTLVALTSFTLDAQRATRKAAAPAAKPPAKAAPAPRAEQRVPFAAGETLSYDVSWSSYLTAGTATMTVLEKKPSFNSTAYYIVAEGRPTPLLSKLYSVYYKMDTLLDSFTLLPQRGSVYSEEGKRHRFKTTQFDRAAKKVLFEYQVGYNGEVRFRHLGGDAGRALGDLRAPRDPAQAGREDDDAGFRQRDQLQGAVRRGQHPRRSGHRKAIRPR